jgi:hypothetical protein
MNAASANRSLQRETAKKKEEIRYRERLGPQGVGPRHARACGTARGSGPALRAPLQSRACPRSAEGRIGKENPAGRSASEGRMSDTPRSARHDDDTASRIARARRVAGGHLMIGHNGFTLYFGKGQSLSGYDCDAMKAAAIAVGEEPSHVICEALSTRPLAEVAQRYRAIGADVRHVPDG